MLRGGSGFVPISGASILQTPTQATHTLCLEFQGAAGLAVLDSMCTPPSLKDCQLRTRTRRTHGSTETAGDNRCCLLVCLCCPGFSPGLCGFGWGAGVSKSRLAREGRRECRCANPRPTHQSLGTREMTWQVFRWSSRTHQSGPFTARTDGWTDGAGGCG